MYIAAGNTKCWRSMGWNPAKWKRDVSSVRPHTVSGVRTSHAEVQNHVLWSDQRGQMDRDEKAPPWVLLV